MQGASASVGGCPEGIIQHCSYRVLQPPWVVVEKKVSNTWLYTVLRVIQNTNSSLGVGNRSRGVSGGDFIRKVSGGEGDVLGGILFTGGIIQCVCVCVCVCVLGGGGGGGET